jgi:hypothetical protein
MTGAAHNIITNNGTGILVSYSNGVEIGDAYWGENSIFSNSLDISAYYSNPVWALNMWWGKYPSSPATYTYLSNINLNSLSTPYTCSYLGTAPSVPTTLAKAVVNKVNSNSELDLTQDADLNKAHETMELGKYSEAFSLFEDKIKDQNFAKRNYALIGMQQCSEKSGMKNFFTYLENSVRPKLAKDDELLSTVLEIENEYLIKEKKYDKSIENLNLIRTNFQGNDNIFKLATFSLGSIYYHCLADKNKAKEYFVELEKKYPEDMIGENINMLFSDLFSNAAAKRNANGEKYEETVAKVIPNDFALIQNYPNPFNPSTSIVYDLPVQSSVKLTVYDLLGREVATLVNETETAGRYNRMFNANGLTSGMYIYKILAKSVGDGKLFTKTAKMLLLK